MAQQQKQQQPAQSAQQQAALSEVYILASTHQLGTLQAQYRAKLARLSVRAVAVLTLIGILGGAGLVGASLLMHGITFAGIVSTLSLLGLVLLCAGLWLAVNALRYYSLRVYVFTEGLVQVKGHKSTVVRWDQVKTMWQKVNVRFISSFYIGTVHAYTLQRDDGKKFTFNDGLRNVQVLGGTLIREVNSRLLPQGRERGACHLQRRGKAELAYRQSRQNTELPTISGPGRLCAEESLILRFLVASRLFSLRDAQHQAAHPAVKTDAR